jgi:hypothetical protein
MMFPPLLRHADAHCLQWFLEKSIHNTWIFRNQDGGPSVQLDGDIEVNGFRGTALRVDNNRPAVNFILQRDSDGEDEEYKCEVSRLSA